MEIEKMVDDYLKKKAMFTGYGMYEMTIPLYVEFAKLVEQATLERAAKVCEDKSMKMEAEAQSAESENDVDTAQSNRASAWLLHVAAAEIRALRGSNE